MSIIIARTNNRQPIDCGDNQSTTVRLPLINVQQSVPSGTPTTIDTFHTNQALAIKWYVAMHTTDGTKHRAFEILAVSRNGSVSFNEYGVIGDYTNYTISVNFYMGFYTLVCASDDPIMVYATRLFVPPAPVVTSLLNTSNIEHRSLVALPADTTVVDRAYSNKNKSVKWLVTLTDINNNEYTSHIYATPITGTFVNYGMLGIQPADIVIDVQFEPTTNCSQLLVHNTSPAGYWVSASRISNTIEMPVGYNSPTDIVAWIPTHATIPPQSISAVDDQIIIPGHVAVKWVLVASTSTATCAVEIIAHQNQYQTASWLQYGTVGGVINVVAEVTLIGGSFVLKIQNNTQQIVTINLIRVPTAI